MSKRLMKFVFFIIAFSASIGTLYGQYHSNIHFHFMHRDEIDTSKVLSFMPFPCYVQQKIIVPAITTDTVELELPYCTMCWLNTAIYFDIQIQHSDTSISPKNYSFDGKILKFPSFSHDTLTISYWYIAENIIYNGTNSKFYTRCLFMCQETWHSTHFKHQDMIIDSIRITLPEDVGFLLKYQHAKEGNDIIINNPIELAKKTLDLFVYDTSYFYKKEISANPIINLYLFRGIKTLDKDKDTDKYIYKPEITDNDELIKKIPSNIDSIIINISSFFDKKIDTLEIIDGEFKISGTGYGSAFRISNNHSFFNVDESFWSSYDWCHEVTHAYNTSLPEKTDSSSYFFAESMTEFLSTYFAISDTARVRNIYNRKAKFYPKTKDTYSSIFQVTKNAPTAGGQGTYGTVYIKPPYCLYKLSQYVGETKFFDLLKQFYAYAKNKETYSFNDFEQFMLSNGIDTSTWNAFKKSLYCKKIKKIDKLFHSLSKQKQN